MATETGIFVPDSPQAHEYNRKQRWLSVADMALGFIVIAVLLLTGASAKLRDLSLRMAHDHYALALFYYVALLSLTTKVVGFGLEFYGFRLEHNYHLSNQKIGGWLIDEVKELLLSLCIGTILAELIYYLIRSAGDYWWLVAWAAFVVLFVVFAQLAPVLLFPLFYKFVPLEREELKQRLVKLSEAAGTRVRGVYEWKLSEKSKKANAALTGLGATRRIILADTLLENYTDDEIEAVLAHELGHHVHKHMPKSIIVQAGITLLGFWLANLALVETMNRTTMFNGMHDFANLPLLILVSSVLSLILLPAMNAYSRYNEWQADRYCWKSIPAIAPFVSAMDKLAAQNLAEKNPSRLVEVLFHSHPPISKRIAAAEAFRR